LSAALARQYLQPIKSGSFFKKPITRRISPRVLAKKSSNGIINGIVLGGLLAAADSFLLSYAVSEPTRL
jgi:hypothetical protein